MEIGPVKALIGGSVLLIGGAVGGTNVSNLFKSSHPRIAEVEGGYVDHKDDLGGATNHGVTERVARESGYTGDMRDLPRAVADSIAFHRYWLPLQLDSIAWAGETPDTSKDARGPYQELAEQLYDISYNAGPSRAGRTLQRCLNVMNNQGRLWRDIPIDGVIGSGTMKAFDSYVERRGRAGALPLWGCVVGFQGGFYLAISEARSRNESFTYGWFVRLNKYIQPIEHD